MMPTIFVAVLLELLAIVAGDERHVNSVRHHLSKGAGDVSRQENPYSFSIDYANHQFLLDGKAFRYISGSIHYFRLHEDQWLDRLQRIRDLGLNAIQFYIPWNFHETYPGQYDFSGQKDVIRFIEMARDLGFYLIVRIGPYSCGETDNGGLPWWLLKTKDIKMRTYDPRYLTAVRRWWSVLLPKLVPYLRKNGGPILMIQPENEYGSFYACDMAYKIWLRDEARRYFGNDTLQFTTDGGSEGYLKCGPVPETFVTVDFGPDTHKGIDVSFAAQRNHTQGPLVNSEFYAGWLVLWGQKENDLASAKEIVDSAAYMWSKGASFNFYMIAGGTLPAFWPGAEQGPPAPIITSYDFSAPIGEAGDCNEKWVAIRDWIKTIPRWSRKPADQTPPATKKIGYGAVQMRRLGSVMDLITVVSSNTPCSTSVYPLSYEDLDHPYGYVLYSTVVPAGQKLGVPGIRDHGYVVLDGRYKGTLVNVYYNFTRKWVPLNAQNGQRLDILVENQGRQTYETINDFKGIIENVTLDGRILTNWTQCPLNMPELYKTMSTMKKANKLEQKLRRRENNLGDFFNITGNFIPSIYIGFFTAFELADTYFDPRGWGKGHVIVNGVNMGRYWPTVGPQITLFVPKPVIKETNVVILLELEQDNCVSKKCEIYFIEHPIFNFTESSSSTATSRKRILGHRRHYL